MRTMKHNGSTIFWFRFFISLVQGVERSVFFDQNGGNSGDEINTSTEASEMRMRLTFL